MCKVPPVYDCQILSVSDRMFWIAYARTDESSVLQIVLDWNTGLSSFIALDVPFVRVHVYFLAKQQLIPIKKDNWLEHLIRVQIDKRGVPHSPHSRRTVYIPFLVVLFGRFEESSVNLGRQCFMEPNTNRKTLGQRTRTIFLPPGRRHYFQFPVFS